MTTRSRVCRLILCRENYVWFKSIETVPGEYLKFVDDMAKASKYTLSEGDIRVIKYVLSVARLLYPHHTFEVKTFNIVKTEIWTELPQAL